MLAFLKRRWVLLSCAVVLLEATMVPFLAGVWRDAIPYPQLHYFGIRRGCLYWCAETPTTIQFGAPVPVESYRAYVTSLPGWNGCRLYHDTYPTGFHRPQLGAMPEVIVEGDFILISVPLWIPLSAVLGWIVIRELRCRERRAKECSTADTSK